MPKGNEGVRCVYGKGVEREGEGEGEGGEVLSGAGGVPVGECDEEGRGWRREIEWTTKRNNFKKMY